MMLTILVRLASNAIDLTGGWGPYIILALTIMSAIAGWSVQRLLKRIDNVSAQVDQLRTDVALLKDRRTRQSSPRK